MSKPAPTSTTADRDTTTDPDDRVLRLVHESTGYGEPVLLDHAELGRRIAALPIEEAAAGDAHRRAIDRGHLITATLADGREASGLTLEGCDALSDVSPPTYAEGDLEALLAVVEREADRPEPDTDVIGWANAHIAAIRNGGGSDG